MRVKSCCIICNLLRSTGLEDVRTWRQSDDFPSFRRKGANIPTWISNLVCCFKKAKNPSLPEFEATEMDNKRTPHVGWFPELKQIESIQKHQIHQSILDQRTINLFGFHVTRQHTSNKHLAKVNEWNTTPFPKCESFHCNESRTWRSRKDDSR